jgi:hypothetical protein
MRKFWLTTIALVLGGVLAALVLGAILFQEPSWQGRTASAWMKEFDGNSAQAFEAMRQMGSKALPIVTKALRVKDPPWKLTLVGLLKKQSVFRFRFTPDAVQRDRAVQACAALGSLARPAIPALGEALGHGSGRAVQVLEKLGPEAIPALATGLTNAPGCGTPYATANALGRMGAQARSAVTNLAWEFEHHSVAAPRGASARALATICQELIEKQHQPDCPEVVLAKSALIRGLSDPNPWIRRSAVESLVAFGSNATEATRTLRLLSEDPQEEVRRAALKALAAIDPPAAPVAGMQR